MQTIRKPTCLLEVLALPRPIRALPLAESQPQPAVEPAPVELPLDPPPQEKPAAPEPLSPGVRPFPAPSNADELRVSLRALIDYVVCKERTPWFVQQNLDAEPAQRSPAFSFSLRTTEALERLRRVALARACSAVSEALLRMIPLDGVVLCFSNGQRELGVMHGQHYTTLRFERAGDVKRVECILFIVNFHLFIECAVLEAMKQAPLATNAHQLLQASPNLLSLYANAVEVFQWALWSRS